MNRNKRKGVYYDNRKSINTQESSNPLAKLTYRELQIEAVKINLPANLSVNTYSYFAISNVNQLNNCSPN